MKWLKKMVIKMVYPKLKKFLLGYVLSNEWQKKLTTKLNQKLDIPRISEATEEKIINQMYDAGQELAVEFIEGIDIEKILDKVD